VVWFGEGPQDLDKAIAAARTADIFLVIGTSAVVYPAASLPLMAKESGAYVVEFNIERTPVSEYADEIILGPVGSTLPEWWEKAHP
jgi:NAD-dependent deacetylase